MKIIVIKLDIPNKNNRVYPKTVMEKAIEQYQNQIEKGLAIGVIAEYDIMHGYCGTDLSKASHIVEKLKIENDNLVAEIRILDTPYGQKLLKMFETKEIVFRPRGIGQVHTIDGIHTIYDYKLISVDALEANEAA